MRFGSHRDEVATPFVDRRGPALERVDRGEVWRRGDRNRERPPRIDPGSDHRGIPVGRLPDDALERLQHGARADLVVVLTNHVLLRCDVRRGENLQDRRPIILGLPREPEVLTRPGGGRLVRSRVLRSARVEHEIHLEDDRPLVADPTHLLRDHATDDRGGDVVEIKDPQDAVHVLRRTESIIRSWLSETQISQGARPSSFSGTFSRSTSAPKPPPRAISPITHDRPPPPRSFRPSSSPACADSTHAWMSGSFRIGSPSWTAPASHPSTALSVRSTLAYVTPWIPSRPVRPPPRMNTAFFEPARFRTI